ncbi:hypothetical protein [Streptomyces sp. NPDC048350]|uniref:hypothetical protein n=1 Tax=Streptomyces sp. NPDC048350 TaxID=3365538 RepID=UPI00371C02B2
MRYFNGTGWLAIFNGTETMTGRTVHVDAWDETTGAALVVDPKRGTRRVVTDYPDFSHLEQADQVVAAVPGGGWQAYWKDEGPDGGPLTEQVLAWLITAKGRATPITVDVHGHLDAAESADRTMSAGASGWQVGESIPLTAPDG